MSEIKTIQIGNLLWEVDPPNETMTWYEAMAYVESLGEGFRLPTVDELILVCDPFKKRPIDRGLLWIQGYYWTNTINKFYPLWAYSVYIYTADLYYITKDYRHNTRTVKEEN